MFDFDFDPAQNDDKMNYYYLEFELIYFTILKYSDA